MKTLIVTGSCGLIGSEVTRFFSKLGITVHGIDSNQRAAFFGPQGDTRWMRDRLRTACPGYVHHPVDIRDRKGLMDLIGAVRPDGVVHAAAQPSHDLAAEIPFDDFETNAVGTLNSSVRRAPRLSRRCVAASEVDDAQAVFDQEWERNQLAIALREVARCVDPGVYQAFELYAVLGQPASRVAKFLGVSRNAVYISKSRVLARLRDVLARLERDEVGAIP